MSKTTQTKKFCKVCFDAKKTEAEYTSHYVRQSPEPGSKVVCPTLLAAECGYCHEKGHTPSCCKTLKAHQKVKKNQEYKKFAIQQMEKEEKEKKEKSVNKKSNVYDALMEDSDEEEEKEEEKGGEETEEKEEKEIKNEKIIDIDEFPSLTNTKAQVTKVVNCNFLAAVTCPQLKPAPALVQPKAIQLASEINWWEDDEESDDDDDLSLGYEDEDF